MFPYPRPEGFLPITILDLNDVTIIPFTSPDHKGCWYWPITILDLKDVTIVPFTSLYHKGCWCWPFHNSRPKGCYHYHLIYPRQGMLTCTLPYSSPPVKLALPSPLSYTTGVVAINTLLPQLSRDITITLYPERPKINLKGLQNDLPMYSNGWMNKNRLKNKLPQCTLHGGDNHMHYGTKHCKLLQMTVQSLV